MNYEGWDMNPMQDLAMPMDYYQRYGHIYPGVEPERSAGMAYPTMYPDIYYRIYPYVHRVCDRMDNPYMLYPSEAQVESMVNECYDTCVRAMPDLHHYAEMKAEESQQAEASQLIRRRPLLRDLIGILLVTELFRRRRRFYPYGYYGY